MEGRAYAQAYLPELLHALAQSVTALAGMVTGQPLAPRDVHADLLRRCRLLGMKGLAGMALGGLDKALWDAWARARGEPLARALGAELRPLRAYNSVGLYDAQSVLAIAEETLAAGDAGLKRYRRVNASRRAHEGPPLATSSRRLDRSSRCGQPL